MFLWWENIIRDLCDLNDKFMEISILNINFLLVFCVAFNNPLESHGNELTKAMFVRPKLMLLFKFVLMHVL